MNLKKLEQFLLVSNAAGYAGGFLPEKTGVDYGLLRLDKKRN